MTNLKQTILEETRSMQSSVMKYAAFLVKCHVDTVQENPDLLMKAHIEQAALDEDLRLDTQQTFEGIRRRAKILQDEVVGKNSGVLRAILFLDDHVNEVHACRLAALMTFGVLTGELANVYIKVWKD